MDSQASGYMADNFQEGTAGVKGSPKLWWYPTAGNFELVLQGRRVLLSSCGAIRLITCTVVLKCIVEALTTPLGKSPLYSGRLYWQCA